MSRSEESKHGKHFLPRTFNEDSFKELYSKILKCPGHSDEGGGIASYLGFFHHPVLPAVSPVTVGGTLIMKRPIANSTTSRISHLWEIGGSHRLPSRGPGRAWVFEVGEEIDKALQTERLEESYQSGFSRRRATAYLWGRSLEVKAKDYLYVPQIRLWPPWQQNCSWNYKGDCQLLAWTEATGRLQNPVANGEEAGREVENLLKTHAHTYHSTLPRCLLPKTVSAELTFTLSSPCSCI